MGADVTAIASDGASLWASLFGASSVVRIDIATGMVTATIPHVPAPAGIAIDQDAVWVTNYWTDQVTRIDPQTNQVVAQISLRWPGSPRSDYQCGFCAIDVLSDNQGVWVVLIGAKVVARIDPATNQLVAIIPVGSQPKSLASDERGVWVGHWSSAGVLMIDPSTNTVTAAIPAEEAPSQLPTITLLDNTVWVARLATNDVVRIDLQSK